MTRSAQKMTAAQRKTMYDRRQDRQIKRIQDKLSKEEIKVFDDFGVTNAVAPLIPLTQSTGPDNRNGNKILLKHVSFRYNLSINASQTANPQFTRVVLVRDNQSDGTDPTYINVFPQNLVQSPVNRLTMPGRFSVLYDKIHTISISATGVPNGYNATGSWKQSYKVGKKVEFDGTLSSDRRNGHIYVMTFSRSANAPTLNWESRILYTDN